MRDVADALLVLFTAAVVSSVVFSPLRRVLPWMGMALIVASRSYAALFRIPRLGHVALGFLLGHALVGVSLCVVSLSLRQARRVPSLISGALSVCAARPRTALHYLLIAVYEECVWRVAVQSRLGLSWRAIVLTSLLFTLAHFRWRKAHLIVMVDLFLFSIVLGYLFTVFQAVYLLIVVHLVRNVDLSYLEGAVSSVPSGPARSN